VSTSRSRAMPSASAGRRARRFQSHQSHQRRVHAREMRPSPTLSEVASGRRSRGAGSASASADRWSSASTSSTSWRPRRGGSWKSTVAVALSRCRAVAPSRCAIELSSERGIRVLRLEVEVVMADLVRAVTVIVEHFG
jgi:hypothetical protein